jgi:ribosomal protein S18 acetylase RimI-like enzyme
MSAFYIVERCDPKTDRDALRLACRAWPEAERAAYHEALRWLLASDQADRVVLVTAKSGNDLVAAQLAQVLPGRVAIIWPPIGADHMQSIDRSLAAELADAAARALGAAGADVAQALSPPDDTAARELFVAGRFALAAELLYLAADSSPATGTDLSFELQPFEPGQTARLAALIERTYVGTLDCPSIDGLRSTADVIAGYQAVGQFLPELWFFVRHAGQDAGCLLLNAHPDVGHLEIVYLAVVPQVRGHGWGLQLAHYARTIAGGHGCERVVLAVDAANAPAIRLYEQAGFTLFDRRCVWIRTLA